MNKKILALILCIFCFVSVFALASCGGDDAPAEINVLLKLGKDGKIDYSKDFVWNAGEALELPTPTRPGYVFAGWAVDGEDVTDSLTFSEDVILEAKWKEALTVDLKLNGGTITNFSESFSWDPVTPLTLPAPTKEGDEFFGWAVNGSLVTFPYTLTANTTFDAIWKNSSDIKICTVTFNPDGGTFTGETTIQVLSGSKIAKPADPTLTGSSFYGWFSGTSESTRWNFDTMTVTGDITLKAWYKGGDTTSCPHDEVEPIPEKSYPATCEKGGLEYFICKNCGFNSFINIPKLEHDLFTEVIPETCATDGYTHVYCLREGCDEDRVHSTIYATGNHTWGTSFVTTIPPTQYVGGEEAKFCEVCGKSQTFKIPSIAEMDGLLWDLDIGNYTYTGGDYVDASFVDIAKNAGLSASSYYTVCLAKNAIDGGAGTFWCADTLADGAKFTGDSLTMSFPQAYDIGMVKLTVPHYYAWALGDDCYVSYDLQAYINDEWQTVGVLSDKNAVPAGNGGVILYEFDSPINTDQLRFVVSHSTRNTPAMIYEIEVMAAVPATERVSADLINSSTITSSGKYNSWATGTETLMDGSHSTGWYTNKTGDIFAQISFPEDKFVTAVQFSVAPTGSLKQFSIYYLGEDGVTWTNACTYTVGKSGSSINITGDATNDGEIDGSVIELSDGSQRVVFTCDIAKFTSGIKLTIDKPGPAWESYVYEFVPYTAIEQAAGIPSYNGCVHNSFKTIETVAPGCTTAGYTVTECYGCGLVATTDAVDAYGHTWSQYAVATVASGTDAGTKESTCLKDGCDAKRTTTYYNNYEDPKITTYRYNAPAAWAQTLDDGNYLATYEWVIPKLQQYGWKATAVLSVCYVDMYVNEWNEYFATGALDLGSHSYTHGGYYSGQINENSLLNDVVNAHYWFMNKFAGQRLLGFATPNGQTSTGTSEYVTGVMASARNGGNSVYFYNVIEELTNNGNGQSPLVGSITVDEETGEVTFNQSTDKDGNLKWVSTRRAWGNMNSYISKSDQTEGTFAFVKNNGALSSGSYKKITQVPVIDETTGEQAVDENGNLLWEDLDTPIYEATSGGYDLDNGTYKFNEKGGAYALIKTPSGEYHYVLRNEAALNFVYDEEVNRLVDKGITDGTYRYVETYHENGSLADAYYEWVEVGSYDFDGTNYTFREDNGGEYKLNHTALGSYEKGINEILAVGGMTVECIHELGKSSAIWSSYASTNSKFQYLDQTGIWVCSYTELLQYMKEQLSATLTLIERTDSAITLTLTDTLDDYMYNLPLTIEVDIDDSWVQYGIKVTQAGQDISFFIENGYVYLDAVPDAGEIVVTPATLCSDGTANHTYQEWTETKAATCTEDGERASTCTGCGFDITEVIKASHSYSGFALNGLSLESKCSVCEDVITKELVNVSNNVIMPHTITVTGDIAETSNALALFDNNQENTVEDGAVVATGEALTIDVALTSPSIINYIFVRGAGTDQYSVEVLYEGDTEYTLVGSEAILFGLNSFELDSTKNVVSIKLTQTTFGNGGTWQEVMLCTIPEIE